MKLFEIYFSPTGGTKKVVKIISNSWNCEKTEINLCDRAVDLTSYEINRDDICIVAVPAFGGRVPAVAVDRIKKLKGNNSNAILVAVYGNREYDDTLIELEDTLKQVQFHCVAAVAAIAEHSIMHQYATGRPNEDDERQLMTFSSEIKAKLASRSNQEVIVQGRKIYRKYRELPLKVKTSNQCNKCGICAKRCPVGAISKEDPMIVNHNKCITCMRCISICPKKAKSVNNVVIKIAANVMKKSFSQYKENVLFL